jgi:hypothetical protein
LLSSKVAPGIRVRRRVRIRWAGGLSPTSSPIEVMRDIELLAVVGAVNATKRSKAYACETRLNGEKPQNIRTFPVERNHHTEVQQLHFVAAEIFVVQVFQPLPKFFAVDLLGNGAGASRILKHSLVYKNRAVMA